MAGANKLLTAGGGGVILTPASSIASDKTVQIPSQDCTLGIQGPAFHAYLSPSNQSVTTNTDTKVTLNAETFDTANCFDSTTNYRFTPNVAGYYQIDAAVMADGGTYASALLVKIYKNGASVAHVRNMTSTAIINAPALSLSTVLYLNGTTDYVELYANTQNTISPFFQQGSPYTYMSGALIRGA